MQSRIGKAKARKGTRNLKRRAGSGGALLSGRDGDWVYYVVRGKQFRRRYVVPKDPRTPKQLRYRAALGGASRYWSHSSRLSQAQRDAYHETAAGVQSHPRLGKSGPLTGQQYFVGRSCASFHQGLVAVEGERPQRLTRATWDAHRVGTVKTPCVRPWRPRYGRGCLTESLRKRASAPAWGRTRASPSVEHC